MLCTSPMAFQQFSQERIFHALSSQEGNFVYVPVDTSGALHSTLVAANLDSFRLGNSAWVWY